jgi:hypothetical protein
MAEKPAGIPTARLPKAFTFQPSTKFKNSPLLLLTSLIGVQVSPFSGNSPSAATELVEYTIVAAGGTFPDSTTLLLHDLSGNIASSTLNARPATRRISNDSPHTSTRWDIDTGRI